LFAAPPQFRNSHNTPAFAMPGRRKAPIIATVILTTPSNDTLFAVTNLP
jgi:hypothetical protein